MRIGSPRTLSGWLIAVMLSALLVSQAIALLALLAERKFIAASTHRTETFRRIDSAVEFLTSNPSEAGVRYESIVGSRTFRLAVTPNPLVAHDELDERNSRLLSEALAGQEVTEARVRRTAVRTKPYNREIVLGPKLAEPRPEPWEGRDTRVGDGATELLWASVLLADGRWLNVTAIPPPAPKFAPALAIAAALAALSMTLAAIWAARRLTRPLRALSAAAGQVGRSSEFHPAPEQGPEDIRRVTREFNIMAVRVKQMLDEQQLLLRAVGHDLRTPLSSLRIRLEFVEDPELRQKMGETIAQMEQLTTAALEASRGGAVNEPSRRIDLASLVEAACEDAAEIGQPVAFAGGEGADVIGRSSELRRVIQNLIDNGVHHGGGVSLSVRREGDEILVIAQDEGPGIPDEDIGRVTEPFVSLDLSRSGASGGHGLGLTIAKAVAERHLGSLILANRPGGGFSAGMRLPAASA